MAKKSKKRPPAKKRSAGSPKKARPALSALRREIDQLDRDLVRLINQRGEIARQIGQIKAENGESIYAPAREDEVLRKVASRSKGPISKECIRAIFRELISGSRALEKSLRVAFLGPEFSYSHLAAIHQFGQSVQLAPVSTIAAVFEEVEQSTAQFGLVPVENSTDGRVVDTLDCLVRSPVQICGEVPLAIHHCLLALCEREQIQRVYSKPQALSQCRNWLSRHLPQAEPLEVASTSEAARLANEEKHAGAVASKQAGVNHRLRVLAENIEDNPNNVTRFAVISDHAAARTGDDKTALVFEVPHRPGALADAMAIFKRNRLNMTWIESFPIPGRSGRYFFFVEFEGHQTELRARRAIEALHKKSTRVSILGSYARMEPVG